MAENGDTQKPPEGNRDSAGEKPVNGEQNPRGATSGNADEAKSSSEQPQTVPRVDASGGSGQEPPKKPSAPSGSADEPHAPEFRDPRLRDIDKEVRDLLAEGKGVDADFLRERENRLDRILDDRGFTDEATRDQAKALKRQLIGLRVVSSEGQTAFKSDLGVIAARTEFPEMQRFAEEAKGSAISNYEQLEGVHRRLGKSSNDEASKIRQDFINQGKMIQERINEEARIKGVAPRALSDTERDQMAERYRGKMDALRDIRQSVMDSLERNFGSARRGLTAGQQTLIQEIKRIETAMDGLNENKDLDDMTRQIQISALQKELRDNVLELARPIAPENEPLPDEILINIGKDEFATEEFLDRLIRLAQEDAPYRLPGMYSDINLNKFLKLNEKTLISDKSERLLNLVRATETLHEMNRILKTSIDQFAQVSQTILPAHLTAVFRVRGVQDVWSLYEGIIKEQEGIETMITDDVFKQIDDQVEKEFRAGVKKRIVRDGKEDYLTKSFKGEGEMEDWEIKRAIAYGRNLIRTLLREGEYIGFSYIPEAQRAFISLAQGQLQGVLNPVTYTLQRFKPGESQGGTELLEEYLDKGVEKRRHGRNKEESRGIVRIKNVQGTRVKDRESTKLVGARGYAMTWRVTEAILKELKMMDNGIPTSITDFFTAHGREINTLSEISSSNAWKSEFDRTGGQINGAHYDRLEDWKVARIEQVFRPLLENSAVAQGALVSSLPLTVPTEVRKMLWDRIADLNPDVMASFLTRLEIDMEAEGAGALIGVKSLEEILYETFGVRDREKLLFVDGKWAPRIVGEEMNKLGKEFAELEVKLQNAPESEKGALRGRKEIKGKEYDVKKREFENLDDQVKSLLRCKEWVAIREKLRVINRLRMMDETERMNAVKAFKPGESPVKPPREFKEYLDDPRLLAEDKLTKTERSVVDAVSQNGKKIAQDLANIQQATVWFMDDIPTDSIKWENLGQSFNRMIGDFGQFAQAGSETGAWLLDPFKMPREKVMEHQVKAIQAAGAVLGIESAQNNMIDIIMTYNEWIKTYPKYAQSLVNMFMSAREKYTSKAQEVSRDTSALSLNEDAMHTHLLEQNHMSILRGEKRDKNGKILYADTFKKAEKDLKVDVLRRLLWANFRDYGPFFLLGMIIAILKGITSPKKE